MRHLRELASRSWKKATIGGMAIGICTVVSLCVQMKGAQTLPSPSRIHQDHQDFLETNRDIDSEVKISKAVE